MPLCWTLVAVATPTECLLCTLNCTILTIPLWADGLFYHHLCSRPSVPSSHHLYPVCFQPQMTIPGSPQLPLVDNAQLQACITHLSTFSSLLQLQRLEKSMRLKPQGYNWSHLTLTYHIMWTLIAYTQKDCYRMNVCDSIQYLYVEAYPPMWWYLELGSLRGD